MIAPTAQFAAGRQAACHFSRLISRDASSSSCGERSPCRSAGIPERKSRCTRAPRSARGRNGDRHRPARFAERCEFGAFGAPRRHPSQRAGSPPAGKPARRRPPIARFPPAPPRVARSNSRTPPDMPQSPPGSSRSPRPSRRPYGHRFRLARQLEHDPEKACPHWDSRWEPAFRNGPVVLGFSLSQEQKRNANMESDHEVSAGIILIGGNIEPALKLSDVDEPESPFPR